MNKKKMMWIWVLIIVVIAIITVIVYMNNASQAQKDAPEDNFKKLGSVDRENSITAQDKSNTEYIKIELDDGILYSIEGKKYDADMVIGDNFFDATISDMYLNPEDYYGKKIEIEGMYLTDGEYTSVGRYSTSNLCAFCPAGYSFIEYQLTGIIDKELEPEKDWIKVIGTLEKANDATSFYQDYFFIKAMSIEIMNEKGNDTVNN